MNKSFYLIFIVNLFFFLGCTNSKKKNIKADYLKVVSVDTIGNIQYINFETDYKILDTFTFNDDLNRFEKLMMKGTTYYIIEGDLLMTKVEYHQYKSQIDILKPKVNGEKLLGYKIDDKIVKQSEHLNMKYAIIKASFMDSIDEYELVKKNMLQAAKDWQKLCNVQFTHISNLDDVLEINNELKGLDLTFVIEKRDQSGYEALSFLPHDPKEDRRIFISPKYFSDTLYDKIGVFRHEIGHTLGFLHEHTRKDIPDCREAAVYTPEEIGDYDPKSVMHYFCNGIGDRKLKFTATDKKAATSKKYYPFTNKN